MRICSVSRDWRHARRRVVVSWLYPTSKLSKGFRLFPRGVVMRTRHGMTLVTWR